VIRAIGLFNRIAATLNRQDWVVPTLARLVFAAVLARYFWASALTKLSGPFTPTDGAFVQIYPRAMEAAGYDSSQLGAFAFLVVLAGAWAEFILPFLIVTGFATRAAALGMIGFTAIQSLTDIVGHMADTETIGLWFDTVPDALILDQRAFWMLIFVTLVIKGAGPVSIDRLIHGKSGAQVGRPVRS
jgi:putative oxidoreductase